MATTNRAAQLTKIHKVLKKHYKPIAPPADRTLLEHLLFACCLEDAHPDAAEETFARLQQVFIDWNEVRVASLTELVEVMTSLPKSAEAARRVKTSLQNIFEGQYSWDLEHLKKQNLGKAAGELAKYGKAEPSGWVGVTPYVVAYVTQHALGGHAIAIDQAIANLLHQVEVIDEADAHRKQVPGMERAIPKSKGIEFASLLQQFAAEYQASPQSSKLRGIVVEIHPASKEKLSKKKAADKPESTSAKSPKGADAPAKKKKTTAKKSAEAAKKKSPAKRITKKKPK